MTNQTIPDESVQKAVHLDSYTGQGLTTKAGENPIPLSELTPRGCIDAAQNPDNMQDIELYNHSELLLGIQKRIFLGIIHAFINLLILT